MPNELPNLGADVVLEFQQSINNIRLFGEAMDGLDSKFGNMERRIDGMRSSLSSLSAQTSRGTGKNLRAELEREMNNLISANGIVLSKIGSAGLKVDSNTVKAVFNKVESAINTKLAEVYKNIIIEVDPNLQVGKVPIGKDDFNEVNKAIARLVRVQLNNLVAALQKHGAGMISAQDLASIQFHIGKGTVQQIINKVKDHIKDIMLKPSIGEAEFNITERDMDKVFKSIRDKVKAEVDRSVQRINGERETADLAPNIDRLHNAINESAREYIRSVTMGVNSISKTSMTKPVGDLSNQLKRFMAKELGTDLAGFNQMFANHRFTNQDVHSAELRRQFSRLEQALNKKISGGLNEEVKEMVQRIESVQINYSPRLHQHLVHEINRVNNQIVKKIREQIDMQFANMRAEIESVQVAPKDINRSRRIRDLGRVDYDSDVRRPMGGHSQGGHGGSMSSDPFGRRDNYFNSFGLEGAVANTFRHILAGSIVGAPMMLLYESIEQFKTSQNEQLKMFANLFAKATANRDERADVGDTRSANQVASSTIKNIMPFVKDTAQFYAIDYGRMSQVASVGSRLLDTQSEVKTFTDVVAKIYNIDREGDPAESIAPGLEAFMGQFGLMVHELEQRVAKPLAVATNVTNATTEGIMNAMMRSGSSFKSAGVSPEQAIAMAAASIQNTGLSGENIGNFYKSVLPRLQSPTALKQLESLGIKVYEDRGGKGNMARSAKDILDEVAGKYESLDDKSSRQVIMDLFGTYQSSKGTTTLMEFEEIKKIMDSINNFSDADFASLMQANTANPKVEMDRAGVSVNLALVDVMEELTPQIVEVSKSITSLATGIREHKEALAGFITFLGNALLGFATVYGFKRLGQAAGVRGAIERVEKVDALMGNRGMFGKGRTQGLLPTNFGSLMSQGALDDTKKTRAIINEALKNPVTAPTMHYLANMTKEQINTMQAYMKDNNLKAKNVQDLAVFAEESKNYRARVPMNPDQLWGGAIHASKSLFRKGMLGLDEMFTKDLANQMQDRQRFDALANTNQGRRVTSFLAGLDENEIRKFQAHLEDIHRKSGKAVNSVGSLTHAINTYTKAQAVQREELRSTNPHLSALRENMDRVVNTLSGSNMNRGVRNMDTFLGSISTKARGAAAAFGGLAKTVGGLVGQLLLMEAVGWTVGKIADSMKYKSPDEKTVERGEKEQKDIDTYRSYVMKEGFQRVLPGGMLEVMKDLDKIIPGDQFTDMGDLKEVQKDFKKFLEESKGFKAGVWGSPENEVRDFMNKFSQSDQDKIWQEFIAKDGNTKKVEEARGRIFQKELERRSKESQEQAAIEEGVTLKEAERRRKDLAKGNYQNYDLPTVQKDIKERIDELTNEYTIKQIRATEQGFASDSESMVGIRRELSKKIIDLYKEQLTFIANTVERLTEDLKKLKEEGASEEKIKDAENELDRWKKNQEKAGGELEVAMDEVNKKQVEDDFQSAMSRIGRSAAKSESELALKDALNQATYDRSSKDFVDATIGTARERIDELNTQIEQLQSAATTPDQKQQVEQQVAQLKASIGQEKVRIRDLQLSTIGLYKQNLQDSLAEMSNEYLQARVDAGAGASENNPTLRNKRIEQYNQQVDLFSSYIAEKQKELEGTTDSEAQKTIQREIRDLQRQSLQAQLGILDELKNTGGTFNLPDNVKAMTYYEYITRNNSHSTYTVQGGDTHVTVTLPNITDGTSADRIKQIGKAFGEGVNEGTKLRLQKQGNPFGYRG